METHGRNRQSIIDIETTLRNIFEKRSDIKINPEGEPVVPASALVEILDAYSDLHNGAPLIGEAEVIHLQELLVEHPDLEMTPNLVVGLIAQLPPPSQAQSSPPRSPGQDYEVDSSDEDQYRNGHTRSISNDSTGTTLYYPPSRPPSRGPSTPGGIKSPLDSDRRQRSTPLHSANAPSSWPHKRPAPAGRRKSDAGNRSDSESGGPPVSFGRNGGNNRARTPSQPSSPSTTLDNSTFSPGSPSTYRRPSSRPHSRTRSQPNSFNGSFDLGYASPDDITVQRPLSRYGSFNDNSFENAVSSLPMPRSSGSDSDEEDMAGLGLVMDRQKTTSMASMEDAERMEALQRTNEDLSRKLIEADATIQNKMEEHEIELSELHQRLEELRSELQASNRDEKELRAKDSRNMTQIAALEAEVAKVQRSLDSAKATYQSLQKQYQEQCAFAEKYRDDLRKRDETIRSLRDAVSLHEIETGKWAKEHESYEDRISQLEVELSNAMEAYTQLDEQKQENLLLKETIDRMRFDMDEMRHAMAPGAGGSSGQSSVANTMSKSLGAELMGQMNWGDTSAEEAEDLVSEGSTAIEEEETEVEEDEDVIQTIITRKRKVVSRANVIESTRRTFEELKEYSDSSTQYDPTLFAVNHGMQTEPEPKVVTATFSIQTDPIPEPKALPLPTPRITVEMEIQTDTAEPESEVEPSRSPSPANDESMASSSSTIVPPTPKPRSKQLELLDEPPAYDRITEADQEEREWHVAAGTLKKWHRGLKVPFEPVPGGVSEEAIEEWKALKQELGVDCMVIDKLIAASAERAESGGAAAARAGKEAVKPRRGGRFYNIYNTYVYGDKSAAAAATTTTGVASNFAGQAMMFVGASALVILAVTPYMAPQYAVPGGATYYDRAAWNSFNSIHAGREGFAPDGTAAVWNFLGRVGGGAARMARGWPT